MRQITFTFVFILIIFAAVGFAQQPGTGVPPFSSIQSGGFDAINRQDLNFMFTIPVISSPGRSLNLSLSLNYNSMIWQLNGAAWSPVVDANGSPTWGWARQVPSGQPRYKFAWHRCVNNEGQNTNNGHYNNYKYVDEKQTVHSFAVDFEVNPDYPECANGNPQTGYATDGSGYYVDATDQAFPKVSSPAGVGISSDGPLKDANGNFITYTLGSGETDWVDTLGRTGLKIVSQTSPMATLYKYRDSNGTWQTITVNLSSYNIKTNFGCSGKSEYTASGVYLPSSIYLPDGTYYSISYESTPGYSGYYTGRISQITLPQGGYYQYSYGSTNDGINCSDGTVVSLTRVVNDGTTSATWSYLRSYSSPNWVTTVTAPQLPYDSASNQSAYTFNSSGQIITEQDYQGSTSGTLLKTVSATWTGNFPTEVDTTFGSQTSKVTYAFDSYGNPTSVSEFDFGASSPTRTTTYAYETGSGYIAANLVNLMTQKIVHSGTSTGTAVYRMDITHDGTSPSCVTGVPGHDDTNYGCSYNTRGNATAVTVYSSPSGPSGGLTTNYSYSTVGDVLQTTDPGSNATTFDYSDSWYDSNCSVSGTKAYPKTVTDALSHVTTTQYYTCTGAPRSVADPNSQVVTYAYGSSSPQYGRLSSVTDPLSNATSMSYSGSTQSESTLTFNSSSSTADILNVLDALARPRLTQRKQSPSASTYDTTQVDYDLIGRAYKSYLPFNATAGTTTSTFTGTYYELDALGRPTKLKDSTTPTPNVLVQYTYTNNDVYVSVIAPSGENSKRRQLEYDGLGRLKSVCEITSASGSGTCSQTSSQTGYWTTYSYDVLDNLTGVSQNAQGTAQTRSYTYDGLSRMTQETNPESGNTYYIYDSDSTCGTHQPDLVKRTDAIGNVSCYAYDGLHRLTTITYPSGSYASVTPEKHFVYDSATLSGTAMSNAVGRLARAYTGSGATTDLFFSYTARGELADVYEATPNSGVYYHATQSYWANGAPYQLSMSGIPTITYGADGEGRPNTVSGGSQNPVTSVTYNYASLPTAVTFGSSDSDSFSFDSNTNRMTQYQFNVNGSSDTGALTWNLNGSLSSLNITDYLNSANTQNCTYSHDDLSRIASVSCGSVWSQTFSFDPFGNISKSGSSSFAASYVETDGTTKNHIKNLSSSYDSNGNLTAISSDATYGYSWDSEGKAVAITRSGSTVNLTYDALGRMVEQNRSGSYTQIAYGPGGSKLALMNGSSLQKAFVPLPAGAQAVYTGSGLGYYRHADWLGTSRLASTPGRAVYYDGAYAPYGESEQSTETGTTDHVFTGQNQDTVTGQYDFLYRQYHPVSGRWISSDPAGLAAVDLSNPQSLNRYAYVLNTPLSAIDPFGLDVSFLVDENGCLWEGNSWNETITHGDTISTTVHWNYSQISCPGGPGNSKVTQTDPAGGQQNDPSNGTPWYKNTCVQDALKTGAINAGIDAIGFIPEAGGVARMIGHGAGYVGVVADKVGYKVVNAVGKTAGTVNSAAGVSSDWTSWVSAGITVGDFIPVVNEFTTVAALSWDTGVAAYKVYQCPK